jgi:hypothetical protein
MYSIRVVYFKQGRNAGGEYDGRHKLLGDGGEKTGQNRNQIQTKTIDLTTS